MRPLPLLRLRSVTLAACALLGTAAMSAAQSTPERAEPCALTSVKLSSDEGAPLQTLLLSGGRIEAILAADAALPAGVRKINGEGLIAVPAFVDGFTSAGCETPEPANKDDVPVSVKSNVRIDMREANRKGIEPSFKAVDVLMLKAELQEKYREFGFGALLSSPRGQLLSGASVLATTREAAMRDIVLKEGPLRHAAFAASGSGYPFTLMGYHAQLRQFFLDAGRHTELVARWEAGRAGARPAFDAELDAGRQLLAKEHRILCEADNHRDIERWVRLADEFGLDIAIAGGRDAWRVADVLKERNIPVFMTLNWGEEVDDPDEEEEADAEEEASELIEDGEASDEEVEEVSAEDEIVEEEVSWLYEEPLAVQRENRRLWVLKRDCALRLREAGVTMVFCSGSDGPKDLLKRVRTLVENGFPAEEALAALTTTPAMLLGVEKHAGKLEPGFQAAVALWTEAPTNKDAKVAWLVVDGFPYEFDVEVADEGAPDEGVDLTGTWAVVFDDDGEESPATLTLTMTEEGDVTGDYSAKNEMSPTGSFDGAMTGHVSGSDVKLETTIVLGDIEMVITLTGEFEDDAFAGDMELKADMFNQSMTFKAAREPKQNQEGGQ